MRIRKTLLCIAFSLIMVVSAVYAAYQQPKQVKAAVVIDDAIVVAGILAACGIVYVGATTDENWLTDIGELSNGFSLIWDQATDNVILQGTYNWNPDDFDPDDDDPNEKPPRWKALIEWIKAHPETKLFMQGTALASMFLQFANLLTDDIKKGDIYADDSSVPESISSLISSNIASYPYVCIFEHLTNVDYYHVWMFKSPIFLYLKNGKHYVTSVDSDFFFINYNATSTYGTRPAGTLMYALEWELIGGNIGCYDSLEEGNDDFVYPGSLNSGNTKYGSQVQTDDSGNITALPVPQLNVQNFADKFEQNYTDLAEGLETEDETKTQTAVDTIIESVGTDTSTETDPDTGTDTEPGTGTTPGTGTDTDTNTGTGSDMTVEDAQQNLDKNQFLLPDTITEKFPFCVPFDIIRAFQLFNSDTRTAPRVELPLKSDSYGIDEKLVIDLSEFDEVAELLRTLELIGFIVALALVSRDLIKG